MSIVQILPLAFVMIAGPQILSSIFFATSESWRGNTAAYVLGAALSISIIVTLAFFLSSGASDQGASDDTLYYIVLALLLFGMPVDEMNSDIEARLERHFRSKPARIVWGMRDRVLRPASIDALWMDTLPNAEVTRIDDAGHFVQEDAHERVVPALTRFVNEL